SKGIPPKSNAHVRLLEAFGPHPDGATMPPEYFKWLGKEPTERGEYFVDFTRYLREHLKLKPGGDESDAVTDQHDRATQRPWTAEQFPHIADWLKVNEKPLAVAVE